jgi:phospholipase/carboxylesterase
VTGVERCVLPDSGVHIAWRPGDPAGAGPAFVLLHGLGGDERSLWVFEPAFPRQAAILAVRGIYSWPPGGCSWIAPEVDHRYGPQDYAAGIEAVHTAVEARLNPESQRRGLVLVGFSQGTGLAFAAAADRRFNIAGIVSLCGFLPDGPLQVAPGMPVYWSHGRRDTLVPIDEARQDVERLKAAGAQVTFCESDAGHKVSRGCVQALRTWLAGAGDA